MTFTVFYDGTCPLCSAEVDMLKNYDKEGRLNLENIHASDFSSRYPHIDVKAADRILHGQGPDGKVLLGLDVTAKAWKLVGKKPWIQVLRWPIIRWFADKTYLFFAKHRMRISSLLMGNQVCDLANSRAPAKRNKSTMNCVRSVDEDAEF